jgi:hypothetical protein
MPNEKQVEKTREIAKKPISSLEEVEKLLTEAMLEDVVGGARSYAVTIIRM